MQDELLLEGIVARDNLLPAVGHVRANRGSAGIDETSVSGLPGYFAEHLDDVVEETTRGRYKPTPVRRVEIPKKEKGKTRLPGIPTARDRAIQQAVAQVLTPILDPTFSESSFGFRPGRSAHDALRACQAHANEGYRWVIDMDLEKFFDTVNHSKLIRCVSNRVHDGRVVSLIHRYLNAGVMKGPVFEETGAGVPQGGPLSPLLANIMLDGLDKELERRGHRLVRYADDCMVLCRFERAAKRTCEPVMRFIEQKLRLKVNREKTRAARIADHGNPIKYLGYGFYGSEETRLRVHPKTIKAKVAVAKTQDKVNKVSSAGDGAAAAMSAFDRMEAKADEMLDRSNAMADLNAAPVDAAAELERKYAEAGSTAAVDDELARLKEEMGL